MVNLGDVEVTITFLEVTQRSTRGSAPPRRADISGIVRADPPSLGFYRFLYESVGEPCYWYMRRLMKDEQLRTIIEDSLVEVYVLYVRGTPAGYVELDRRLQGEVEIAYFGLLPEFIGRGLGSWLLSWAMQCAWQQDVARVWLHTCTLDHPSALPMYQRAGLQAFKQEKERVELHTLAAAGFDVSELQSS